MISRGFLMVLELKREASDEGRSKGLGGS